MATVAGGRAVGLGADSAPCPAGLLAAEPGRLGRHAADKTLCGICLCDGREPAALSAINGSLLLTTADCGRRFDARNSFCLGDSANADDEGGLGGAEDGVSGAVPAGAAPASVFWLPRVMVFCLAPGLAAFFESDALE